MIYRNTFSPHASLALKWPMKLSSHRDFMGFLLLRHTHLHIQKYLCGGVKLPKHRPKLFSVSKEISRETFNLKETGQNVVFL